MLKADRNLGLRKIYPRQKYFYCFISMETCWKGFKTITFETKLFFENVGKISTAMGRTILKYIYPWSVLHTFTIRWISTLDMTLARASSHQVHVKLYTVFKKSGLLGLAMLHIKVLENSPLLNSYLRHLSRFSENLTTLS